MALLFIIIGAVFDFFDGMSARLLGVSSPIGKELDSLADDITFGFAPSAIIFSYLCTFHIHLLCHGTARHGGNRRREPLFRDPEPPLRQRRRI